MPKLLKPTVALPERDNSPAIDWVDGARPLPPPLELRPGQHVDDFEILRVLGKGGFAVVYLARQTSLDRQVALKVSGNVGNVGQEARILANLEHDNIVKVYSQTVEPQLNLRLLCMQYVPGSTLAEFINSLPNQKSPGSGASVLAYLDSERRRTHAEASLAREEHSPLFDLDFQETALWLGMKLANALAFAHQRGILHLDVKPSNVLLNQNGRPYLTDFNVSVDYRSVKKGERQTLGGTMHYMAPEQMSLMEAASQKEAIAKIDHRADIYALGVVIRDFLSEAAAPSSGNMDARQHTSILKRDAIRPPEKSLGKNWRKIDVGIRLVLSKCTAADPEDRFESATSVAQAFQGCLELREIIKSIPRSGALFKIAGRFPIFAVGLCGLGPSWMASAFCAVFLQILFPDLFQYQQYPMVLASIAVLDLACAVLWIGWLRPFLSYLRSPYHNLDDPSLGAKTRLRLLGMPNVIFLWMSFLWLPGHCLAFYFNGPDGRSVSPFEAGHILLICLIAGMMSTGLTVLLTKLVALRVLYPRLWLGSGQVRARAREELKSAGKRLRLYYFILAWAPMAAAAVSFLDPLFLGWELKLTIFLFLSLGLMAILFDFTISHTLAKFVFAFTGAERERS